MSKPRLLAALLATSITLTSLAPQAHAETHRNVDVEIHDPENFMWTLTKSAFYGALLGGMVGLGALAATEFEMNPMVTVWGATAGMGVGIGVGTWEVSMRSDTLRAGQSPSHKTYMVRVLNLEW